jgi:transcription termination/antitermination protein NusG
VILCLESFFVSSLTEGILKMALKWYGIHTYSGFENKVKLSLLERVKNQELEDFFGEVLIPSETVMELKKGERKTTSRKFFPGYILVNMELNDETWHVVKETAKVTGFVGGNNPVPITEEEIGRITRRVEEGVEKPRPKIQFEVGETVRVVDGPFLNFAGVVEDVKPDKAKLRVMVSIFGRATPVELEFMQVEKQ